jgi:hypothetical protein
VAHHAAVPRGTGQKSSSQRQQIRALQAIGWGFPNSPSPLGPITDYRLFFSLIGDKGTSRAFEPHPDRGFASRAGVKGEVKRHFAAKAVPGVTVQRADWPTAYGILVRCGRLAC